MKCLINGMKCNTLSQQLGWFDGRVFTFNLKVKGSNVTNGVYMVNNCKLSNIFLFSFLK
jgi:hypothetical protein